MEYAQVNKAPSSVQEVPTQAEDTLRTVRAAVDEYAASASAKAREAAAYADRQVRNSPWTAVGIGFGVGMIFGVLVAMAARSQHSALDRFR